jgi:hypothetical protein
MLPPAGFVHVPDELKIDCVYTLVICAEDDMVPAGNNGLTCVDEDTTLAGNMVGANDADVANDDVNGVNVIDLAADAVVANDAEVILPLKLPVLICKELLTIPVGNIVGAKDAEVILPLKLPVLICKELLTIPAGNIVGANDAEVANDAEIAVLASPINDPVKLPVLICTELLTIPAGNIVGAKDADVANDDVNGVNVIDVAADAVVAKDAEIAVLASPINDPVKLPVLIWVELLTIPAGNIVGANDADVILPLKLPVLICRELLTVPAGINLNPVNDTDLLTSASKFTIIDDDTVLSNICKPDIFAVVIGMLE